MPLRQGLHWGRAGRDKVFMGQGLQAGLAEGRGSSGVGGVVEGGKEACVQQEAEPLLSVDLFDVYPKCQ